MGKFVKPGRCVLLLQGRQAGKKAIVVKVQEEKNKERKFGNALVVGIARYPRKVTRKDFANKKKFERRTTVKPFVKYVNLNHLMPTRYQIASTDLDFKDAFSASDKIDEKQVDKKDKDQKDNKNKRAIDGDKRKLLKTKLQTILSEKYRNLPASKGSDKSSHLHFFYKKLRF